MSRRFDTLNPETQDMVECLLPALARSFGLAEAVDIIPADIRMRAWDCERRDHVKHETENDPRNWGVQFLRDLMAISRLNRGNLTEFQTELRAKIVDHDDNHPWCRLADIKEIKLDYENPKRKLPKPEPEPESSGSSTDEYLEELVDVDLPPGMKRGRKHHEMYEARPQVPQKRRRLRKLEDGTYVRPEKRASKGRQLSSRPRRRSESSSASPPLEKRGRATAASSSRRSSGRHTLRAVLSENEEVGTPFVDDLFDGNRKYLDNGKNAFPAHMMHAVDSSNEPLEVLKLQAELEVAEAELRTARLRMAYIEAKEQAERAEQAAYGAEQGEQADVYGGAGAGDEEVE